MNNKTRLLALICTLTTGFAFSGCDDGDSVGSTHNPAVKTSECATNADCADKGDRTECSAEGVCVAPAATPECTTNDDCADKGDRTECSAEGVCIAPSKCDNGELDEGEECDGILIADNLDVKCDEGKQLIETPVCLAGTCKIDMTQSCVDVPQSECATDEDCAGAEDGKTKCDADNHVCIVPPECETNDDCADKEDGKTTCNVDKGICVECLQDDACTDNVEGRTKCDVETNACVVPPECESHADCADKEDGRIKCDVATQKCYTPECVDAEGCVDNTEGKIACDIDNGVCVECISDNDCAGNNEGKKKCDTASHVCVVPPECETDADCAEKEDNKNVCNAEKGICVQCTQDVHCVNCADNKTQCNVAEGMCVEPSVVVEPEKPVTYKECNYPDEDKDGISDEIEGKAENRDSDGDTIPDYQDLDSDGDTIPDSIEGGTNGCSSALPIDSDRDDTPDYLDLDSDNNGIPDSVECGGTLGTDGLFASCIDTDGDSYEDFRDSDNDGDYISDLVEIVGMVNPKDKTLASDEFSGDCNKDGKPDKKGDVDHPIDCDGDTIPDYMDVDSDNDKISDVDEGQGLVSGGKFYSHYMTDADGDGIADGVECGGVLDGNGLYLNCVDSNGNGIPDYLELDSDSDGIPDSVENVLGSNPTKEDSDNDDTPDMIEYAICLLDGANCDDLSTTAGRNKCKCPAIKDPKDNPVTRGDFVFVTPYKAATTPDKQTLSFETSVQTLDIYFSIDTSGSMGTEIKTIQNKLPSMLDTMQCADLGRACEDNNDCSDLNGGVSICSENKRCIVSPKVGSDGKGCFADMWTGIGWWGNVNRFENAVSLQSDPDVTVTAAGNVVINGHGTSENSVQPPACAVGGTTYCTNTSTIHCYSGSGRVGCVGYRPNAVKIYIQAGDEANSNSGNYKVSNAGDVGAILKKDKVRYIGLWGSTSARDNGIKQVACEAGSCPTGVCAANCQSITTDELNKLYIAQIADATIETVTIDMVRKLAGSMELVITSNAEDIDKDAAKLIDRLVVNVTTTTPVNGRNCTKVTGINGTKFQGIDKLKPGVSVCYDVIPVQNQDIFEPDNKVPKIYKARVKVLGDGSVLNSGVAYFLVPPEYEKQ